RLILAFSCPLPDLVVTRITPLAALELYTEDEVASFNTEMLSMSCMLIWLMSTSGIPSTTMRGLLLLTVPKPRMTRLAWLLPAIPVGWVAERPGTRPDKPVLTLDKDRLVIFSSTVTIDTAPVILALFWVPYPTTTTSSRSDSSGV